MEHMFFNCLHSKPIWDQLGSSYKYSDQPRNELTMHNWLKPLCHSKSSYNRHLTKADILPFTLWHIWIHRNNFIFNNNKSPLSLKNIVKSATEFKLLIESIQSPNPTTTIYIKWKPPDQGTFKLNIDGSSLGNPGRVGIGGIIRDCECNWIVGFNMSIPHATNIYMEGLALIQGLKIAIQQNIRRLVVETDCSALVDMLTYENGPYQNLITDCRWMLTRAGEPQVTHIFREANGVADAMAKTGSNSNFFGNPMLYFSPPPFVVSAFKLDKLGTLCPRKVPLCNNI
ncbi:putative ribonuclease h protein [Nicotiana attenuata]|uniref:Ribonuclease h protein n=1 Tax=Nicotiana attenuata TaxID=49451 RepID=A0A1J6J4I6_NICAT|nr:putative ribonuclease h protein [Nicotiana attenuata]